MTRCLKLLFVSTPVGPLGSGLGGGVELTIVNLVKALTQRDHQITIVAPESSNIELAKLIQIPGTLQPTAHTQGRDTPAIMMDNAVLANQWGYAQQVQYSYDLIVNFAYDWLPSGLSMLEGDHIEAEGVELIRSANPPGKYFEKFDRHFVRSPGLAGRLSYVFPLLPLTQEIKRHLPPSAWRASRLKLVRLNLHQSLMLLKWKYPVFEGLFRVLRGLDRAVGNS